MLLNPALRIANPLALIKNEKNNQQELKWEKSINSFPSHKSCWCFYADNNNSKSYDLFEWNEIIRYDAHRI